MKGPMKFSIRSGQSFARGLTIDALLEQEDVTVLYERWDNRWGEPLEFQGGVKAITCDMVMQVPLDSLVKAYGKKRAERFIAAAREFGEV